MAVLNRCMERPTNAELAQNIETLREDVHMLMVRVQLVSIDIEATMRHQAENGRQCIQLLQEIESATGAYTHFLKHIE